MRVSPALIEADARCRLISSRPSSLAMFCERCQHFWNEAIAKAQFPNVIEDSADIHWNPQETTLHRSIRDLKNVSDHRCRLCRVIYSTPTQHEHQTLLKDHDEAIDVVLDISTNNGPHPVLSVEFREANEKGTRIHKRMIASCSGLMTDGEQLSASLSSSYLTIK